MAKSNGQTDPSEMELEHELPPAQEGSEASSAPQDTAALEAELQQLRAERDQLLDRLARAQAEFENARRRAAREQQDYRDYALSDAIRSLLPILDSFDRALASKTSGEEFRSGMELIGRQLHDALGKLGVTEIDAQGQPFDPTVHEAIEVVDTTEVPDHHVLQQLQRGYMLKGRLLRPAMVRVARNPGQ
ncbi:MAG: nucleotide exchange factor GrpE [Terriglobales bacterium]